MLNDRCNDGLMMLNRHGYDGSGEQIANLQPKRGDLMWSMTLLVWKSRADPLMTTGINKD